MILGIVNLFVALFTIVDHKKWGNEMKKYIILLIIFSVFPISLLCEGSKTIKIYYPNAIIKETTNSGKYWKKLYDGYASITFKRLGENRKISYDNGLNWETIYENEKIIKFTNLSGLAKLSYDNGKNWEYLSQKHITDNFLIYPNPCFIDECYIELTACSTDITIKIYNNNGDLVKKINQHTQKGKNKIELDLSDLNSGSYFIITNNEYGFHYGVINLIK